MDLRLACVCLLVPFFASCAPAPLDYPRQESFALAAPQDTTVARALSLQLSTHPQQSAFYPLFKARDALVARLALIDAAQSTIDAQLFLFGQDVVGMLLLEKFLAAADRGVRVRLLIDDWNQAGRDAWLAPESWL